MLCSSGCCDSAIAARCCLVTWGPNNPELQRDHHNDRVLIRWICGIKDRNEAPSASLLQKHGIEDITSVLHCWRLRWYGHAQQATSCIKYYKLSIPGTRKQRRARKTWSECVKNYVNKCGLAGVDPLNIWKWMWMGERTFLTLLSCTPLLITFWIFNK